MLEFLHSAPFLFREDAYSNYCWSVDVYGAYQPASFIYLCSESFSAYCAEKGIRFLPFIPESDELKAFPTKAELCGISTGPELDGLVIRITGTEDVPLIRSYLDEDRNVLLLLPQEWWLLLGYSSNELQAHHIEVSDALSALNVEESADPNDLGLEDQFEPSKGVWWTEIAQIRGRLFLTKDRFISDGFFMKGYGKSDENDLKLESLRRELGTFRSRFLVIELRNSISSWPCHEPMTLIFDIQNKGTTLEEIELSFGFPDSFEIQGVPEFCIPYMAPLDEYSLTLQVTPRRAGKYQTLIDVGCSDPKLRTKIHATPLNVTPSYASQLRRQSHKDSPNFECLKSVMADAETLLEEETLLKLEELAKIEPAACLTMMRSVAEKLAQKCTKDSCSNFNNQIRTLKERNFLSQKAIGYLHTVRILGNLASHPSEEILTLTDVQVAAFALSYAVEEMIGKLA